MRSRFALALLLLAGCEGPVRPPPPLQWYDGLPVSGSVGDARRAGFTRCLADRKEMRCRRDGVTFLGLGPLNAAADLVGSDGRGGFDQLTLWHDRDQNAFIPLVTRLEREGWRACFTGEDRKGDQAIYTRPGLPVRISMDLSYWGKRRLRIIPNSNRRERIC